MDLSRTPLTERQIALLVIAGAKFYHDDKSGHVYVSNRYWNGITQALRDGLARMVSDE